MQRQQDHPALQAPGAPSPVVACSRSSTIAGRGEHLFQRQCDSRARASGSIRVDSGMPAHIHTHQIGQIACPQGGTAPCRGPPVPAMKACARQSSIPRGSICCAMGQGLTDAQRLPNRRAIAAVLAKPGGAFEAAAAIAAEKGNDHRTLLTQDWPSPCIAAEPRPAVLPITSGNGCGAKFGNSVNSGPTHVTQVLIYPRSIQFWCAIFIIGKLDSPHWPRLRSGYARPQRRSTRTVP